MNIAKKRISVFVDAANFYYLQRDALGWKVAPDLLLKALIDPETEVLHEAFWYQAETAEHEKFLKFLSHVGFTLRTKPLKTYPGPQPDQTIEEANMDVEITTDMMVTDHGFDGVILVSHDGDFAYALESLRSRGKTIAVAGSRKAMSSDLRACIGNRFVDLVAMRSRIERTDKPE